MQYHLQKQEAGFSLVELMVALVIVAILLSVALPGYRTYVQNGNRQAAHSFILTISESQQRFFTENKAFAEDLTGLGYATATIDIDSSGAVVATGSSSGIYRISFTGVTATAYSVQAVPLNGQTGDTGCATLTVSSDGSRSASGTHPAECW